MQTLTPGSFLKLENSEDVEALKFTARRLAEHTANVVAENLPPAALAELASNLWEKAEYVARETERRRLREIFTENFTVRFRELKPEISLADALISEVLSSSATIENGGSAAANTPAPEVIESGETETVMPENASFVSPQQADETEAQEKRDEFLGFVKTDEPFPATTAAEAEAVATIVSGEGEQEIIQTADETVSETSKSENEQNTAESKILAESASAEKQPPVAAKVPAENDSQVGNANKTSALQTKTKEPFEFGKCTISLNLILLPSSAGESKRKAIVSASSHNQPPEIEYLEITEGEDLTEIAELVRGKLARFKNTLPAKYIEQLRQSKTKSAKKAAPAKASTTTVAALDKPEVIQANVEKTSGSQSAQSSSGSKADLSQTESMATKETESAQFVSTVAVVPQSVTTANNLQPSLF